MENKLLWVGLFVLGAALSWGVYVPTVHRATNLLNSNLRAFLFVGVAYFLVAVLVPALFIFVIGDPTVAKGKVPNFQTLAMIWGIAAGVATCASVYMISQKAGSWGIGLVVAFAAAAIIVHFVRPPERG